MECDICGLLVVEGHTDCDTKRELASVRRERDGLLDAVRMLTSQAHLPQEMRSPIYCVSVDAEKATRGLALKLAEVYRRMKAAEKVCEALVVVNDTVAGTLAEDIALDAAYRLAHEWKKARTISDETAQRYRLLD